MLIEFNENGTFLDLEKKVSFSGSEKNIQEKIRNKLSKKLKKYKLKIYRCSIKD